MTEYSTGRVLTRYAKGIRVVEGIDDEQGLFLITQHGRVVFVTNDPNFADTAAYVLATTNGPLR